MSKNQLQNYVDLAKSSLNTITITLFALCGFTFINLKNSSFLDFIACVLSIVLLVLFWFLAFSFFKQYNSQIKD